MAGLQRNDMRKEAANGPYAGIKRPDVFVHKIKDNKPFIIGTTANGIKVTGVSLIKYSKMQISAAVPVQAAAQLILSTPNPYSVITVLMYLIKQKNKLKL